jgi:hypothetical protein
VFMKRLHLFEFEDQAWFPRPLRRLLTDVLQHQLVHFGTYNGMIPKIRHAMECTGCDRIVDLCSGSGGPVLQIREGLATREGYRVDVVLTDKFPDPEVIQHIESIGNGHARYQPESVDATAVPRGLRGFRTLFSSFHHFRPDEAVRILQDAVNNNVGIGIFEFTERSRFMLLKAVFPLIAAFRSAAFIRPVTLERVLFTYALPIVPFTFFWDALVSNCRTYTPQELKELVSRVDAHKYHWEIGREKAERPIFNITYLIGYPRQDQVTEV